MKTALWTRVSTGEQQTQNQLSALREWAKNRGFEVVEECVYEVELSAWNGKQQPELKRALEDARLGKFEVMLVWALDRLSREGVEATLKAMRQFKERGVRVLSHQESWTDGPADMQELLASIFAWMAHQESQRRSERIRAGIERRKLAGIWTGRGGDKKKRKRAGYLARGKRERAEKVA